MSDAPLVSIVTPVYNGERFLRDALASATAQTYQNWELVLLNNASTDQTLTIAQEFAAQDDRIKLHCNETLLPIMQNWNHALSLMNPASQYCKILHADDQLMPDCLEKMVAVASAPEQPAIIGSYSRWGDKIACAAFPYPDVIMHGAELCKRTLQGDFYPFLSPSCLMFRCDAIAEREPFYRGDALHADVEVCLELLADRHFGFVHQVLTVIGKHDGSVTATDAKPMNTLRLANLQILTRYGPQYLSGPQLRRRIKQLRRKYYKFLAKRVFTRNPEGFWQYHMDGLADLGHQLRFGGLFIAVVKEVTSSPGRVFRNLRARLKPQSE